MNRLGVATAIQLFRVVYPQTTGCVAAIGCSLTGRRSISPQAGSPPLYSTSSPKIVQKDEWLPKTDGIFSRVLKKIARKDITRSKLKITGYFLYESIADNVDYPEWFKTFKLDDNFMSWFVITEIHVWMMMVRAMADIKHGEFLRNHIVEAMWEDVNIRTKKLGVASPSLIRAQLDVYNEQFNAAIIGYDEGLLTDDMVLAGAIWRRFFRRDTDDPILIEKIVKYIREQTLMLEGIPLSEFMKNPSISWPAMK